MGTLVDQATGDFARANKRWLDQLFRSFAGLDMALRQPGVNAGHRYTVRGAVLNTRLGVWGVASVNGATCGDNGGRTTRGQPCKKKPVVDGRCAHHPPPLFTVVHNAGDELDAVELDFGDDARARPIPAPIPWRSVQLRVGGRPLSAIDQRSGELLLLAGTRVWGNIIMEISHSLGIPPDARVRIGDAVHPADLMWTVGRLRRTAQAAALFCEGRRMEDNMLLEDYGLRPGAELRLAAS